MNSLLALPAWFNPWGWVAICAAVVIILIVILVLVVKGGKKRDAESRTEDEPQSENATAGQNTEEEENPVAETEEKTEAKPAAKTEEKTEAKSAAKTEEKTEAKPAAKTEEKTDAKPAAKTANKTAAKSGQDKTGNTGDNKVESENKKPTVKTYHVSKRKEDNKWQVKAAGGAKAIKLFLTQAEAIEFAKTLAENQDARIVIHKEDGSFRRLTYNKK